MLLWLADVPGKQVADAIERVVGDAGEHVAEVGFWIEAVELGGLDQGIEGGGAIAAGVGPGKKVVFPAEGQRPDLPFGGVVVDLQPPVVEVAPERRPEVAGVADGGGELAFSRQLRRIASRTAASSSISGVAFSWRIRRRRSAGSPRASSSTSYNLPMRFSTSSAMGERVA